MIDANVRREMERPIDKREERQAIMRMDYERERLIEAGILEDE